MYSITVVRKIQVEPLLTKYLISILTIHCQQFVYKCKRIRVLTNFHCRDHASSHFHQIVDIAAKYWIFVENLVATFGICIAHT